MSTYVCPEFAATGIELQIIELQARREEAIAHGWGDEVEAHDREITALWGELAELVEQYPEAASTAAPQVA